MPLILIAGTVTTTKTDLFPVTGRPRCEVTIKVIDGEGDAALYRVVAYDDAIPDLECLVAGDAVSIQGSLELETAQGPKGRRLTGLFVIAAQILPLRQRSPNRMPIFAAR